MAHGPTAATEPPPPRRETASAVPRRRGRCPWGRALSADLVRLLWTISRERGPPGLGTDTGAFLGILDVPVDRVGEKPWMDVDVKL
jgi:hypothetical protein